MINPEIRAEILFQIVSYLLKGEIVSPQIASQNQALQSSAKCKLWHLWWHIVLFPTQVRWYNTNVCDNTVCQREGDLEAMRTLVHNKCSNIKWLSAVFVVIGRITYKIWTLSRQAKLTKNSNAKSLDPSLGTCKISLPLHCSLPAFQKPSRLSAGWQAACWRGQRGTCNTSSNICCRSERQRPRCNTSSMLNICCRSERQVVGAAPPAVSEPLRLFRGSSAAVDRACAWDRLPTFATIHGRPQRHKRSHWGTNTNTNNKSTMMQKKQNTSTAWQTWNNLWQPSGTLGHKFLL